VLGISHVALAVLYRVANNSALIYRQDQEIEQIDRWNEDQMPSLHLN
jgi:hypothetical protein